MDVLKGGFKMVSFSGALAYHGSCTSLPSGSDTLSDLADGLLGFHQPLGPGPTLERGYLAGRAILMGDWCLLDVPASLKPLWGQLMTLPFTGAAPARGRDHISLTLHCTPGLPGACPSMLGVQST